MTVNALYNGAREGFLSGRWSWPDSDWVAYLVTDAYVFDAEHTTMAANVPAEAHAYQSITYLTNKTSMDGFANCDPISFGRVLPWGTRPFPQYTSVIFVHAGSGNLLWHGTAGINLPFTPNGAEIILFPDVAFGGFFRL